MLDLFSIGNLDKIWLQPIAYHMTDKLQVYLFYPYSSSLYQLLHSSANNEHNINQILINEPVSTQIRIKYEIVFQISKILFTL